MTDFVFHSDAGDELRRLCEAEGIVLHGPDTQTHAVLVGQTIGVSVPGAVRVTWSIPMAAIGGYALNAHAATAVPPDPTLPGQLNPKFHFIASGTFPVPFVALLPNGQILTDSFVFVVQSPAGQIAGQFAAQPGFFPNQPGGADGQIAVGPGPGITISSTLTNPSALYAAQFGFVQVATPQRTVTTPDGIVHPCTANGVPLCDTTDPNSPIYQFGPGLQVLTPGQAVQQTMTDRPWLPTISPWGPLNGVGINQETFATYVMFQCVDWSAAGSLMVPVLRLNWGWKVQATRVPGGFTIAGEGVDGAVAAAPVWPAWPSWGASVGQYQAWGGWSAVD